MGARVPWSVSFSFGSRQVQAKGGRRGEGEENAFDILKKAQEVRGGEVLGCACTVVCKFFVWFNQASEHERAPDAFDILNTAQEVCFWGASCALWFVGTSGSLSICTPLQCRRWCARVCFGVYVG